MQGRWGQTPFAALALSLALGVTAAQAVRECSFAALAAATASMICAAWLALESDRLRLSLALGLCAVSAEGTLLALAQRDAYPPHTVQSLLSRAALPLGEVIAFDACVAEETIQQGEDTVTLIELHGLQLRDQWIRCSGTVPLRLLGQIAEVSLQYGDRIRGWAKFDVPRNFQNPGAIDYAGALNRKGVFLLARSKTPRLLERLAGDCGNPWMRLAASARQRVRQRLADLSRAGMHRQAAVLACIVLGDDAQLDTLTREAFQNSGTYHVLVVSGLHVAWLSWVLMQILRLLSVPAAASRVFTAAGILFYAQVVGFQASVSRCLWMFAFFLVGRAAFRQAAPANVVLASGFCLIALSPEWLFDVGFQLSFVSVAAIVLMGVPVIERMMRPCFYPLQHAGEPELLSLQPGRWQRRGRRWRVRCEILAEACGDRYGPAVEPAVLACLKRASKIALSIGSLIWLSIAVQVWMAPLLAYYFNRLSWVVPLANLVIIPLSSLVLMVGIVAAVTGGIVLPASWVYSAAGWMSALLCAANERLATFPGGWQRCPTPPLSWVVAGLLLIGAWSFFEWHGRWIPWTLILFQLACLASGSMPFPLNRLRLARRSSTEQWEHGVDRQILRITFLDVGQGDSIVLQLPDSRVWVLDAGGFPEGYRQSEDFRSLDVGEAVVSRYLWSQWIPRLDRIIVSHPHSDHIGGMTALLRNFRLSEFQYAAAQKEAGLSPLLDVVQRLGVRQYQVTAGQDERVGPVQIQTVHPPSTWRARSQNDASLVLRLQYGRFTALLMGDLDGPGESQVVSRAADLRSLLMKAPHHGSRNAAREALLRRVQPRWAVVSVGRNNPFGNPSVETLQRLLRSGTRPLLTSDQGAITFETDGINYLLSSHRCGVLDAGELPPYF